LVAGLVDDADPTHGVEPTSGRSRLGSVEWIARWL